MKVLQLSALLMGPVDIGIFILALLINIFFWSKQRVPFWIYGLVLLSFGLILPLMSSAREIDRNVEANGLAMDSLELLYTLLTFPIYWIVMIVQLGVLVSKKALFFNH